MAIRLLQHWLYCAQSILVLGSAQNGTAKSILSVQGTPTLRVNFVLCCILARNVVSNIEPQLAKFCVIGRIALIGGSRFGSVEFNMVSGGAASLHLGLREGNSRLAVLAIVFVVFKSRFFGVLAVPPESSSVILTVQRQTLFNLVYSVGFRSVPTVVSNRTLVGLLALLVGGAQFCTLVGPGPHRSALAELLGIAVSVAVAEVAGSQALAHAILAIHAYAFPGICARAAIVQVDLEVGDVPAVGFGELVVEL